MKNIFLLPTDEPSRLCFRNYLFINKDDIGKDSNVGFKNLYITSNETIKEGEWCILLENYYINGGIGKYNTKKASGYGLHGTEFFKKIILTTDPILIAGGVQAIDDGFLEWYVKNPSCEEVKVEISRERDGYISKHKKWYKIIIPSEEPKQETLEEAKLRQLFKNKSNCYADTGRFENDGSYSEGKVIQAMDEDCFINVIKEWQQERMYSEDEVKKLVWESKNFYHHQRLTPFSKMRDVFNEWFNENKKK